MSTLIWQIATPVAVLAEMHCHVWLWNIKRESDQVLLQGDLSEHETAIADRFLFSDDRTRYIQSHAKMRSILGTYLGCSPKEVELTSGPFGKPVLSRTAQQLHFSLSHASSYAVLAVAHTPLGVDLEQPRLVDPSVATMYFSPREQTQLAAYTEKDWTQCFFRCWTRKEAVLKAEGVGLTLPLDSFDVEIAHDKQPALLSHREDIHFTCDWKLHDLSPSGDVIVALSVHPGVQTLQLFSLEDEFLV